MWSFENRQKLLGIVTLAYAFLLHPYILEILEALGLADALLQMHHTKVRQMTAMTPMGPRVLYDFEHLKTRYPYFTMMPQARFLEFLVGEAQSYPHFHAVMGARVEQLREENGVITGVQYRATDGMHEVQALLTIGADGRFSRLRHLAQLVSLTLSAPIDLLWFKLPVQQNTIQEEGAQLYFGAGRFLVAFDRYDYWQIGDGDHKIGKTWIAAWLVLFHFQQHALPAIGECCFG